MKKVYWWAIMTVAMLAAGLLVFSCGDKSSDDPAPSNTKEAKTKCEEACKTAKTEGQDLSNGPCLWEGKVPDWVCDVAHNPRTDVDDNPDNQCPKFGAEFKHFVEVDPEKCKAFRTN